MIESYPSLTTGIDFSHQKVHEGRYFSAGRYESALADAANIDILLQIGSASTFHMIASAGVAGAATLQIFEGTTFSNAGTGLTVSNHNRASSKVFSGTVTYAPTLTGTGTALNGTMFLPGGDKHSSGGSGSYASEFILSASTNYLVRLTNVSGSAARFSLHIEGYQPTL